MLYELLAGRRYLSTPRRPSPELPSVEIQRIIREEEPPKPSTRLSSLGERIRHGRTWQRRVDIRTVRLLVRNELRGDLDWITMKALEKDRNRRYDTAAALSDDLERHLRYEPVEASPPSAVYRMRRFARRYRGQVLAAGLVLATLLAGVISSTAFALRSEAAARQERVEKERADREAEAAGQQRDLARRQSYTANLAMANLAFQRGDVSEGRKLLDRCPEEYRGWEWSHCSSLTLLLPSPSRWATRGTPISRSEWMRPES